LGAVAQPGSVVHQLIDARIQESHKLDLAHRLQTLRRHADAEPADEEFGKRRIQHALRPETLLQSDRGAEDAAVDADILAEHDDGRVILHRAGKRQVDGFDQRDLRHQSRPSSSRRCVA
jgi:hypothetical protein